MSGGNQQKIVLGKWLVRLPRLLTSTNRRLASTIGAKSEIARIVREMADAGVAVLVISSELKSCSRSATGSWSSMTDASSKTSNAKTLALRRSFTMQFKATMSNQNTWQPKTMGSFRFSILQEYIVYIVFAAVVVYFAITIGDSGFMTVRNMFNLRAQRNDHRHGGRHDIRQSDR